MKRVWEASGILVLLLLASGAAVAGSPSEITFPSHLWREPSDTTYLHELKAAYEKKYPDVKVKDIEVPISVYFDKLYTDMTAGTPPDIAVMYDPEIRQYIEADLLEPLDPWLKSAGLKQEDFVPAATMAENKGHVYAIVEQHNPRVLFYNDRLFKAANVAPPTDFASFSTALKALRDPKKQQFGFATAAKPGNNSLMYIEIMPLVAGFGGAFFRNGKPTATSPETVAALTFYKKIYDEDLIPIGMDTNTHRQMFFQGKVAMYASGSFIGGAMALSNPGDLPNLRTAMLPFPGHRSTSITVYWGIPKRAAHKEEAARLMMMLLEEQWQRRAVETSTTLRARKGMVSQSFLQKYPWFASVEKASVVSDSYAPQGAEAYAPEVIKVIASHVESMLFRGVDAPRAAEAMQADLEKLAASKRR